MFLFYGFCRDEEQKRGITMKSSAISLTYNCPSRVLCQLPEASNKPKAESATGKIIHLINLVRICFYSSLQPCFCDVPSWSYRSTLLAMLIFLLTYRLRCERATVDSLLLMPLRVFVLRYPKIAR